MSTLPSRIREACGVERFDVADTQMTLIVAVESLVERGMKKAHAITFVSAIYRTAQKELTLNHWPTRTKVLTYALGLSDADIVKLHRDLGKVLPKKKLTTK